MKYLYSILLILSFFVAKSQDVKCGFIDEIERLNKEFPGIKEEMERGYLNSINVVNNSIDKRNEQDTIYILPVVFHVLYNNDSENLADSIILSQLKILNEDYRRKNSDTSKTREIFKDVAADIRIEFVLANKDPDGNPTNGINRVPTTQATFYDSPRTDKMKDASRGGADGWDASRFLNIWVCDYSHPQIGPWILGYAYPPRSARNWPANNNNVPDTRQGVVLHYQVVGKYNNLATTSTLNAALGRTATHEVGHYLGLRHTWGDGRNSTGCNLDDYIEDTPNERTQNGFTTCSHTRNTCGFGSVGDLPDQIENYMDYSKNTCQNMFTNDQKDIMRFNLTQLRPGMAINYRLEDKPIVLGEDELDVYYKQDGDKVSWVISIKYPEEKKLFIRNTIGQLVFKKENIEDGILELDMNYFASGMYIVSLIDKDGNEIEMEKVIK